MRRIFLATFCVIALLTKTDTDSAHVMSRLGTVESIVERGTYRLDDSIFIRTVDKVFKDGHFYSHQPPLLSTLEAPVYWALRLPGTRFNNRGRFVMIYAFSLLTNGIALALTVIAFAAILAMAGVKPPLREWAAVLLPMGTWLLPYGLVPNNHGIAGLLVAVLFWVLLTVEWQGATRRRALAVGAVLGLLAGIEVLPIVSFVPLTVFYLLRRRDLDARGRVMFAAGLAVPLIAHGVINVSITGDVLPAGFHPELFRYEGTFFEEAELTGTIKYTSVGAAAEYAWTSLFAHKGFFVFAPLTLLGLIAGTIERRWWLNRAGGVYAILMMGAAISLTVSLLTTNNHGGEAVGFRHAVYLSPALIVLLLPWLMRERTRLHHALVLIIAVTSTLSMLLFAVRQPWSVLTLNAAPIGSWEQYVPIVARLVNGTLFSP